MLWYLNTKTKIKTCLHPVSTSQRLLLPIGSFSSNTATSSPSSRLMSCSWQALQLRFSWYSRSTTYSSRSRPLCSSVCLGISGACESCQTFKNFKQIHLISWDLNANVGKSMTYLWCIKQLTIFLSRFSKLTLRSISFWEFSWTKVRLLRSSIIEFWTSLKFDKGTYQNT